MCKMCTGCICVVLITGWSATCTKVSCAQVLKDAAKMGESFQPIIDEMKSKSKTGFHLGLQETAATQAFNSISVSEFLPTISFAGILYDIFLSLLLYRMDCTPNFS